MGKTKKPKSKIRSIIEWILTGLFIVGFGFVVAGQIDGYVNRNKHYGQQIRFGYATFVVQTDSMEPEYKVKTAIITYLEDVDKIYERFAVNHETVDITFYNVYSPSSETERELAKPNDTSLTRRVTETQIFTHRVKEIHVNPDPSVKKGDGKYFFIAAGINLEGHASQADQYQVFTEKEILGRVVVNSPVLGGFFAFIGSPLGLLALLLIPAFYLVITSVIDIFKAYKEPEEAEASDNNGGSSAPTELSKEDRERLKQEMLDEMMHGKGGK